MARNTNASGKHRLHIAKRSVVCPICGEKFSSLGYGNHRWAEYKKEQRKLIEEKQSE